MADEINNAHDIIDSRDIIARIEELESDEENLSNDEIEELKMLRDLAAEASDYAPDWQYGTTLIRKSYFVEYAQELAEDIGAVKRDASWPNNHIDWEAAAHELAIDYTEVDFGGVPYMVR